MVLGLPSWTSYTLSQPQKINAELQWRLDVRLESNHASICDRLPDGVDAASSLVPLFPFGLSLNPSS